MYLVDELPVDYRKVQAVVDVADVWPDALEAELGLVDDHQQGLQQFAGYELDVALVKARNEEPTLQIPEQQRHQEFEVRAFATFATAQEVLVVWSDVVADGFQEECHESFACLLNEYFDFLHDFDDAFELEVACV